MSRSEIIIHTEPLTRKEEHKLIALIARCGYTVYLTYDASGVAFSIDTGEAVTEIKERV